MSRQGERGRYAVVTPRGTELTASDDLAVAIVRRDHWNYAPAAGETPRADDERRAYVLDTVTRQVAGE